MEVGSMRHRLAFQSRSTSQDAFGQPLLTWVTYMTVWGAVEDLSGRELLAAQQVNAEVTTNILIRYRAGVLPVHRVFYDNTAYNIRTVSDPTGRKRELRITSARGMNEG